MVNCRGIRMGNICSIIFETNIAVQTRANQNHRSRILPRTPKSYVIQINDKDFDKKILRWNGEENRVSNSNDFCTTMYYWCSIEIVRVSVES